MNITAYKTLSLAFAISLLTACGGGGSGSDSDSTDTANPVIPGAPEEPALASHLKVIKYDPDSEYKGYGTRVAIYDTGFNEAHTEFAGTTLSQASDSLVSSMTAAEGYKLHRTAEFTPDTYDEDYDDLGSTIYGHGSSVATLVLGKDFGIAQEAELQAFDVVNQPVTDTEGHIHSVQPISEYPDNFAALLHLGAEGGLLATDFANLSMEGVSGFYVAAELDNRYQFEEIRDNTHSAMIVASGNLGLNISDIFVNIDSVPECTVDEISNAVGYEAYRCNALHYDRHEIKLVILDEALKDIQLLVTAIDSEKQLIEEANHPGNSCKVQERFIAAPGAELSTAHYANNEEYRIVRGTSFAAPLVTGAAAAVKEKFSSLSNRAVLRVLLSTADRDFADYDPELHGQGVLDLQAALNVDPGVYADDAIGNMRTMCIN